MGLLSQAKKLAIIGWGTPPGAKLDLDLFKRDLNALTLIREELKDLSTRHPKHRSSFYEYGCGYWKFEHIDGVISKLIEDYQNLIIYEENKSG